MKIYKYLLIIIAIIAIVSFYTYGVKREPVEKLSISSAAGYDLEETVEGIKIRTISLARYILRENKEDSEITVTKGKTIGEAREDRQRKIDRKYLLGLEKVYIVGEEYAMYGIKDIIDILFRAPEVRDNAFFCVCDDKAEDLLKLPVKGYPSSGDFIEGLIKYSREYNFFPENYKLIDAYIRLEAEGRNLAVPYIEINEGKIQIAGIALFKGTKMIDVVPLKQAKILNLLRENNIMGILTVEENPNKFVNFYGKSKRKVKCYKEGDKYRFVINLKMTGDLVSNEYEPSAVNHIERKKKFESLIESHFKKDAEEFLEKIKYDYKVDCLELGRIAAAKYGRDTGVDWNEIVSNSDIEVNVDITIDRYGRGDY